MSGYDAQRRWYPAIAIAATVAGLALAVGFTLLAAACGGSEDGGATTGLQDQSADRALPDYVIAGGDQVALAYQFALDRPDVMLWMPCYCGCGGHSGHRNARDCFVKATSSSGDVQLEEHGSACDVCVDISLKARQMTLAGASLRETRTAVDQEFGDIGPGTDTPLPPQ
jgi:hypothetical protein